MEQLSSSICGHAKHFQLQSARFLQIGVEIFFLTLQESRVIRPEASNNVTTPAPSPPPSPSSPQQLPFLFSTSEDSEFLQISAFADIPANTQVYINYGPYSNRELFLNYGFMIPDNPYDRCRLSFEIPFDSADLVMKKQ